MKINKIQEKITKKEVEIQKLKAELLIATNKQSESKSKWLYIPELKIEVEVKVHDKNKSWDNLGLKDRENELLTVEQCIFLANSKYAKELKMDSSSTNDDFFIKQPFNRNREKGYVAGFYSDWDGSYFYSGKISGYSYCYRGVRFCRKKLSEGKK